MDTPAPPLVIKGLAISPRLFSTGYPRGGGPCTCSSMCCAEGVYADVSERDRILAHADLIRPHMDATQSADRHRWFEPEECQDPDFPTGRCVGTTVINDKCAFLDGSGRCSLQVASSAAGMERWALKPLYCILYPIEISDGVVNFQPMLQDEQLCCTVNERFDIPVFEACRDELTHLVGEDGFWMMQTYYAEHFAREKAGP